MCVRGRGGREGPPQQLPPKNREKKFKVKPSTYWADKAFQEFEYDRQGSYDIVLGEGVKAQTKYENMLKRHLETLIWAELALKRFGKKSYDIIYLSHPNDRERKYKEIVMKLNRKKKGEALCPCESKLNYKKNDENKITKIKKRIQKIKLEALKEGEKEAMKPNSNFIIGDKNESCLEACEKIGKQCNKLIISSSKMVDQRDDMRKQIKFYNFNQWKGNDEKYFTSTDGIGKRDRDNYSFTNREKQNYEAVPGLWMRNKKGNKFEAQINFKVDNNIATTCKAKWDNMRRYCPCY